MHQQTQDVGQPFHGVHVKPSALGVILLPSHRAHSDSSVQRDIPYPDAQTQILCTG